MIYEVGNTVRIALNANEQIHSNQEVWEYQGEERKVSRRKIISYGMNNLSRGAYYELEGVVSGMGCPFAFLEEQLILVQE